jgi:hypothetical protein
MPRAASRSDLEALPVEASFRFHPEPARPHPLGPRDVLDALTLWGRTILTVVAVAAAAVIGYQLGKAADRLNILASPRANTGVGWVCEGRLSGVFRIDGLPSDPVSVKLGPENGRLDFGSVGATAVHGSVVPGGFLADDTGHLELLFANAPYAGVSQRVRLVASPLVTGEEVREVNVPVLPCGG